MKTGVYPCYENQFRINKGTTEKEDMKEIKDCVSFSVSFDNGVEEWTPFDTEGWVRRLLTAKSVKITVSAKRNVGDPGNDLVASLAWVNGRDAEKDIAWRFNGSGTAGIRDPEQWKTGSYPGIGIGGIRTWQKQ